MGETRGLRLNTYEFSLSYCCALLALCSEQFQDHLKQLTQAIKQYEGNNNNNISDIDIT